MSASRVRVTSFFCHPTNTPVSPSLKDLTAPTPNLVANRRSKALGGAPPSAFDRILATRLGVGAVKSLSDGETGVLVGWQKNEVTRTPFADIVGRTKPIDTELVELARILAK